jgi:hypothetical protein
MAKNKKHLYFVNNTVYETLTELAKDAGISYPAAYARKRRGWTDEEIFHGRPKTKKEDNLSKTKKTVSKKRGAKSTAIIINGKKYDSVRHAYNVLQPEVPLNTVRQRLYYGWSLEESLEIVKRADGRRTPSTARMLFLEGERLNSSEAARKYQVPYSTVLDRIRRGATDEQAVGLSPIARGELRAQSTIKRKKRIQRDYHVGGKTYNSIRELADAYDLSPTLIYNRINQNGWSLQKAVSEPISEEVTINGVTYRSALQAFEKIGITSLSVFQERKRRGLTLEVCLGLESLPNIYRHEVNGKSFTTLENVASFYNITLGQLNSRLQYMSLEEAVIYTPSNGRYSKTIFERDSALANTIGHLYFVKIEFEEGALHKIGITQNSVKHRLSKQSYAHTVIREFEGKLSKIYEVEQAVLSEFQDLHYRADDEFEGRTETFLLTKQEEIEMLNFILDKLE